MNQLGPLKYIEKYSAGTKEGQEELTAAIFHGYGADANDLSSLAPHFNTLKPTRFLFFQGFKSVPIGPGWTGRAWWDIDVGRLQKAMEAGEELDLTHYQYPGLPEASDKVMAALKALDTPLSQLILGGFSQGSMLATHVALSLPQNIHSLIVLSGQLVHKTEWNTLAAQHAGLPFFMSHGRQDAVLPYKGASKLESLFLLHKMRGSLFSFEGGHDIPMECLGRLNLFYQKLAAAQK